MATAITTHEQPVISSNNDANNQRKQSGLSLKAPPAPSIELTVTPPTPSVATSMTFGSSQILSSEDNDDDNDDTSYTEDMEEDEQQQQQTQQQKQQQKEEQELEQQHRSIINQSMEILLNWETHSNRNSIRATTTTTHTNNNNNNNNNSNGNMKHNSRYSMHLLKNSVQKTQQQQQLKNENFIMHDEKTSHLTQWNNKSDFLLLNQILSSLDLVLQSSPSNSNSNSNSNQRMKIDALKCKLLCYQFLHYNKMSDHTNNNNNNENENQNQKKLMMEQEKVKVMIQLIQLLHSTIHHNNNHNSSFMKIDDVIHVHDDQSDDIDDDDVDDDMDDNDDEHGFIYYYLKQLFLLHHKTLLKHYDSYANSIEMNNNNNNNNNNNSNDLFDLIMRYGKKMLWTHCASQWEMNQWLIHCSEWVIRFICETSDQQLFVHHLILSFLSSPKNQEDSTDTGNDHEMNVIRSRKKERRSSEEGTAQQKQRVVYEPNRNENPVPKYRIQLPIDTIVNIVCHLAFDWNQINLILDQFLYAPSCDHLMIFNDGPNISSNAVGGHLFMCEDVEVWITLLDERIWALMIERETIDAMEASHFGLRYYQWRFNSDCPLLIPIADHERSEDEQFREKLLQKATELDPNQQIVFSPKKKEPIEVLDIQDTSIEIEDRALLFDDDQPSLGHTAALASTTSHSASVNEAIEELRRENAQMKQYFEEQFRNITSYVHALQNKVTAYKKDRDAMYQNLSNMTMKNKIQILSTMVGTKMLEGSATVIPLRISSVDTEANVRATSQLFDVCGLTWNLKFYPRGESDGGHCSLFLGLDTIPEGFIRVHVDMKISLKGAIKFSGSKVLLSGDVGKGTPTFCTVQQLAKVVPATSKGYTFEVKLRVTKILTFKTLTEIEIYDRTATANKKKR